ncbi:acyltransferase family protein [Microbulbifer aggregans]|uniref:acyltransferase family protein n=1 Tax=Microbulbifer aggregans TaxID=1769779 RepID=UPI001CFD454E|nr:acyltransferase family protein [Microbulbifer aggregans]
MDRRLYHLDFLRAFMLFLGVFYRSAHADAGAGDYDFVRDASGAFRMACFFIISGYFSVSLLERKGSFSFLKSRTIMLLTPALFCIAFLVPITNDWMLAYYANEGAESKFEVFWQQHAWFLIVLLMFTLPLAFVVRCVRNSVHWLSRYMSLTIARITLFSAVVLGCILFKKFVVSGFVWSIPYSHLYGYSIWSASTYFPYFILGVFMYLWRDVYVRFNTGYPMWGVIALAIVFGLIYLESVGLSLDVISKESHVQHGILLFYKYAVAIAISLFLFSVSARFLDKDFWIVRIMAQSAYTVYIVHFTLVAWFLLMLQEAGMSMNARMMLSALATCVVGVLFHYLVVKKVNMASLLFNGKLKVTGRAGEPEATISAS